MNIEQALEETSRISDLKRSNPDWEIFYMLGYLTAREGINIHGQQDFPLPVTLLEGINELEAMR